jgi:hypothetical protein
MNRFLVAIALIFSVADARTPFGARAVLPTAKAAPDNALAKVPGLAVRGGFDTKAVAKNVVIGASSFLLLPLTRDIVSAGKVRYGDARGAPPRSTVRSLQRPTPDARHRSRRPSYPATRSSSRS